jgi:hypothetical protein
MWQMHMQMLTKRMRSMEIAQTIDEAITEWYSPFISGNPQKIHNGGQTTLFP